MTKSRLLPAVILFTLVAAGASAREPDAPGVGRSSQAAESVRPDVRSDARRAKQGIKATAQQVRHDIKHFFKSGFYEVKRGVKEAFR